MKRFTSVESYIAGAPAWHDELLLLRDILQSTELTETIKWGAPCYTYAGKNVVGMGAFKSYVGLWFFQGAVLEDKHGVLLNAQEGKTKAMRQWRFSSSKEIKKSWIKAYVKEAIRKQSEGQEIKADRQKQLNIPPQLSAALNKHKAIQRAFGELTKGKQREFADYVAEAKREETKTKRIEKILPMIREGVGLHDKYRNC